MVSYSVSIYLLYFLTPFSVHILYMIANAMMFLNLLYAFGWVQTVVIQPSKVKVGFSFLFFMLLCGL